MIKMKLTEAVILFLGTMDADAWRKMGDQRINGWHCFSQVEFESGGDQVTRGVTCRCQMGR